MSKKQSFEELLSQPYERLTTEQKFEIIGIAIEVMENKRIRLKELKNARKTVKVKGRRYRLNDIRKLKEY